MPQHIAQAALLVRDYDEAIDFYVGKLGFHLILDTPMDPPRRWVVVAPPGSRGAQLVLARADTEAQVARIGDQTGGRVALFLYIDDFWGDHEHFLAAGVRFVEAPREEPYGTVAVFEDLYGTKWDLLQPK